VRIRITDPATARYEVPLEVPLVPRKAPRTDYHVVTTEEPFGIAVVRSASGVAVFNTSFGALVYRPQFLQLSTLLPSPYVYGLGERWGSLRLDLNWRTFTIFASGSAILPGGRRHVGAHPFYLGMEGDGSAHGVFLLNSNAMEIHTQPAPGLTFRALGGILDFYVFLGPTVDEVVAQYCAVVGRPHMPPYWALGFHSSRAGFNSTEHVRAGIDFLREAGVPQDAQWLDTDHAVRRLAFTYDRTGPWRGLPHLASTLHLRSQRLVLAMTPFISPSVTEGFYPPYDRGVEQDIFIKKRPNELLIGKAWSAKVVYPDFLHPQAQGWWGQLLAEFRHRVPFDGLWLQGNEPANDVDGAVDGCPPAGNPWDVPPHTPTGCFGPLNGRTVCMAARHHGNRVHYDVHNLYGWAQQRATFATLSQPSKHRPLVMSHSTFTGSGAHGGHILGDVYANYVDLAASISGILAFSLFGIPLVGADICAFADEAKEQLCSHWYQLGALYPFARHHLTAAPEDRDPGPTGYSAGLLGVMKDSLLLRYELLPYLYTLFWEAHTLGTPVARALFYDHPTDPIALTIESQFLWGKALLISPVLAAGASSVEAYFPAGAWYDFHTGSLVEDADGRGRFRTLPAPLTRATLQVRGGTIVPRQRPGTTTAASRTNLLSLVVALSPQGTASGVLYWDDGIQTNAYEAGRYFLFQFSARPGIIELEVTHRWHHPREPVPWLGEVTIFGVDTPVNAVHLRRRTGWIPTVHRLRAFTYSATHRVLRIQHLKLDLSHPWKILHS